MKTFAVMSGNIVRNVIVAEDMSIAKILDLVLIEYTNDNPAGLGYRYDQETGLFSPPVYIEEPPIENSDSV